MSAVVFVGPTLRPGEGPAALEARFLPPAAEGDIYRAVRAGATAIGVIDCLAGGPSAAHKELLWALGQGAHVFGSAAAGALRAAELAAFGMEGVGAIAEAVRRGEIADDDEVLVASGDTADGFRPLSIALVDIRATLAAACAEGLLAAETQSALEHLARRRFYPERGYERLLADGRAERLPEGELAALERWLPSGQVRQQRADALLMLAAMRGRLSAGLAPREARFRFERTGYWEELRRRAEARPGHAEGVEPDQALLEELRLDPERHRALAGRARAKRLAGAPADLTLAEMGISLGELLGWYFGGRLRVPAPPDINHYAREFGYADTEQLVRALLRELWYERSGFKQAGAPATGGDI